MIESHRIAHRFEGTWQVVLRVSVWPVGILAPAEFLNLQPCHREMHSGSCEGKFHLQFKQMHPRYNPQLRCSARRNRGPHLQEAARGGRKDASLEWGGASVRLPWSSPARTHGPLHRARVRARAAGVCSHNLVSRRTLSTAPAHVVRCAKHPRRTAADGGRTVGRIGDTQPGCQRGPCWPIGCARLSHQRRSAPEPKEHRVCRL